MGSNTFLLIGNGPYQNRGCEAIIRGTVKILRSHFDSPKFIVVSQFHQRGDLERQIVEETDPDITHLEIRSSYKRFDMLWFLTNIFRRAYPPALKSLFYGEIKQYLTGIKAVLAVGGDNYSIDYGRKPIACTTLDDLVVENHTPMIIWGASVGPFSKDPSYEDYIIKHFQKLHLMVRESLSYEYLIKNGLQKNVELIADPAFALDPIQPHNSKWNNSIKEGAIGINFSPLMARFIKSGQMDIWEKMAVQIIDELIKKVKRPVYLIPHVENDHDFLRKIYSRFQKDQNSLYLIPNNLNAAELKWIISKMCVFAGARTHSTIAALSSCVPTLCFGYSIKAQGISRDMYGHSDFCIMGLDLSAETVVDKVLFMLEQEKAIIEKLQDSVMRMKNLAFGAGKILKSIIDA